MMGQSRLLVCCVFLAAAVSALVANADGRGPSGALENGSKAPSLAKLKKNSVSLGKIRSALKTLSKLKAKPGLSDAQRAELEKVVDFFDARAVGAGKLKTKTDAIIAKQAGAKGAADSESDAVTVEAEFVVYTDDLRLYFPSYAGVIQTLSQMTKQMHDASTAILDNLKG